ncbi:hypothetical protein [Deinococcus frigens]|uniref:hypothetical protein n=1 Tax=Deinococcus frigens TaxID=249403 RepID=UPI000496BD44|nr:hypothetical protein [Deinococcus frigens]
MFNPDRLEALPTVRAFRVEGEGHSLTARVDLTTGASVSHFLPPSADPALCPLPDGGAVFVPELAHPDAHAYRLPASLTDAVRAALNLCRVEA